MPTVALLSTALLAAFRPAVRSRAGPISLIEKPDPFSALGGALARVSETSDESKSWVREGNSWLLLPQATPWACIHFVGGAGFGSAPQICYDALLSSLVQRLGVAVVATPYDIATDHWSLSRKVHQDFDAARSALQERYGLGVAAPTYRLGHSLGGKLLTLGSLGDAAAAEVFGALPAGTIDVTEPLPPPPPPAPPGAPLGLLAFNNFALADSAALASNFLSRLQGGETARTAETSKAVMDAFSMAQAFATAAGADFAANLEVSPTPAELERAVGERYAAADTRVWQFRGDALDSSDGLLGSLPPEARVERVVLNAAPGHLTPVVFSLEAADIDPTLALLLGSNRAFSFGDEDALAQLCDALCDWVWPSGMATPTTRALAQSE